MREQRSEKYAPTPWQVSVAVEDVAETGARFDLVADAQVRAAVARMAGLRDLPRLEANFDVTRRGAGRLHVAGRVSATVGQVCVVTLEPLANEVEESVDLLFVPLPAAEGADGETATRGERVDDTEPLIVDWSISARSPSSSSYSGSIPILASPERSSSRRRRPSRIQARLPRLHR